MHWCIIFSALFPLSLIRAQSMSRVKAGGLVQVAHPPGPLVPPEETVLPEDANSIKACKARILHTNPETADRYSQSFLDTFCGRQAAYQRTVLNGTNKPDSGKKGNFTDAQLAWLHSLHKCPDPTCVCQNSNSCSTEMRNSSVPNRVRTKRQRFPVDDSLPDRAGRAVRREIRQMSDEDRHRYFRAMNNLKNDLIDGMSKYDIMVMYHTPEYAPEAHFSSALLPYHREMLKNIELALRMVDPGVSLPYWDSTVDAPLPNPADSIIWTSEFFGNGFGDVRSGPFANWVVVRDAEVGPLSSSGRLARNLGGQGRLMDDGDIGTIMSKQRYRDLVYCFDPFFELAHGGNHMWVGGHMGPMRTSPNDPLFYSLHSFVDLIWENWRWNHQSPQQRETEYWGCSSVSRFDGQMSPYSITNADGLSNRYTQVFYSYTDRPACPGCGGNAYLFCDNRYNKCVSKIRPGGACNGYEGLDACVNGQCVNGRCAGGGGNGNNDNNVIDNDGGQTGGGCRNNHACCLQWSRRGECNQNQGWMRSNCPAACGACQDTNNGGCTDTDQRCSNWASQGQCDSNSVWMSIGCPVTCNSCTSTANSNLCTIDSSSAATNSNQSPGGSGNSASTSASHRGSAGRPSHNRNSPNRRG